MSFAVMGPNSSINLQATVASSSSGVGEPVPGHHPITCHGSMWYTEENVLQCEHAATAPDDLRTQACVIHSIVILMFEILHEREYGKV